MVAETTIEAVGLRARQSSSPATIVPSLSESSSSDYEDPPSSSDNGACAIQPTSQTNGGIDDDDRNITLHKIVTSTAFQRRLSRQSSLPWGHKPSPLIGASCLLFLLPIPLLLRACCPGAALSLASVTASSYLSDHVFTGLESWTHALDRALAPMAFGTNLYAIYCTCGLGWASLSVVALKCHVLANYYSKKGMYDQFVIWHSLWHAAGVGLIVVSLAVNRVVGTCWDGSGWENTFIMNDS